MFTSPRTNVIASDEGFTVEVLGRTGIQYSEGQRSMFVDSEVLSVGHGIAVFKDSIKAWPSPQGEQPIDEIERQRILDNIRRAIAFQDEPVEIC
jgi:immunity protein 74 of polymorphic toxin system